MSEVISSFKSLRAGSEVFALLMLFLCVILHNMCICPFGMLCLSVISMILFVKKYVGSVYVSAYGGLSEGGLCVFREWCPVSFPVVGEGLSVLL